MSGTRSHSLEMVALRVARPLLIVAVWCGVLALGMSYFFSPIGAVAEPTFGDLIGFGFGFTITGLLAASVALAVAGKRKWAVEIALAVGVTMAMVAVLAYLALWGAPWTLRSRMDAWSFLRLQQEVRYSGEAIEKFYGPVGAGVGATVGAIAGGLIVIARRRPRLARWTALGLLVACATGAVRPILFDAVIVWGMVINWLFWTGPMTLEHVWATATIFGAITGAFGAWLAIRVAGAQRSGGVSRAPGRRLWSFPTAQGARAEWKLSSEPRAETREELSCAPRVSPVFVAESLDELGLFDSRTDGEHRQDGGAEEGEKPVRSQQAQRDQPQETDVIERVTHPTVGAVGDQCVLAPGDDCVGEVLAQAVKGPE